MNVELVVRWRVLSWGSMSSELSFRKAMWLSYGELVREALVWRLGAWRGAERHGGEAAAACSAVGYSLAVDMQVDWMWGIKKSVVTPGLLS